MSRKRTAPESISEGKTLYGINILNVYKKPNDLIKYLLELHEDLKSLNQDVQKTPKGFFETVQFLLNNKLLESTDKKVKLLVSCCMVDIFRIYAPETPYKDPEMLYVFDAIITQIRGLQTFASGSEDEKLVIYILQSLASVKSCVIPVILAQKGLEDAFETVQMLFAALIDSIRPEHSNDVLAACAEIIQFCIIEFEGISNEWIDTLLLPLLPGNKAENPTSYRLVAGALRMVQPMVQVSIATFVHDILVNPAATFQGRSTELADEIYPLIFELHLVSPALIFGVIPELTVLLTVEEDEIRGKIVKLLSKLYTSELYDYVSQFPKDFKEFSLRINDRNSSIRTEMVETVISILNRKPETRSILEESIVKKLRDPDEDIRLHCLSKLLEFAQGNLIGFSKSAIDELCDRVKDKKIEVRKMALTGIARLYFKYISSKLGKISDVRSSKTEDITETISPEILDRLANIPGVILKSWGYPDFPTKHLVIVLVQEYLIPKSLADFQETKENKIEYEETLSEVRSSALLLLFSLMKDEVEKVSFNAILNFKSRVADEIGSFLRVKSSRGNGGNRSSGSFGGSQSDDSERLPELRQALYNLSVLIPISDRKPTAFDKLITNKDKFILKILEGCIGVKDSIQVGLKRKEELQRRLDSKSLLGEYFGVVYDCAAHFLFDSSIVKNLLETLVDSKSSLPTIELANMLAFVAKACPKTFVDSAELLSAWLDLIFRKSTKGKESQVRESLFASYAATSIAAAKWLENDSAKKNYTENIIQQFGKAADPIDGLKFGEILCHLAFTNSKHDQDSESLEVVQKFLKQLLSKKVLSLRNDRILNNMCLLSFLFRVPPTVFDGTHNLHYTTEKIVTTLNPFDHSLSSFLTEELFPSENNCEVKSVGLRIYANILCLKEDFCISHPAESKVPPALIEDFCKLLFQCISSEGKVFSNAEVNKTDDQEQLLEACAIDAILLFRVLSFADSMTIDQWQSLAWILVKSDQQMKRNLLQNLTTTIQVHAVQLKFLALPCLFACDSELSDQAQKALIFAIKRLRRTHEEMTAKLVNEQDEESKETLKYYVQEITPERVLPYLLYLLSYHPNFPSSMVVENAEDRKKVKDVLKCVQLLIHSLQTTLRNETSNLPYLFKQLNLIIQKYVDRIDPENIGLHFVTRLTISLLNEQVKTSDNVQVYPGEITLPNDILKETSEGKMQQILSRVAGQTFGLESDAAIEKVLHAAYKSKKIMGSPGKQPPIRAKATSPDMKESKREKAAKPKKKVKEMAEEAPVRSLPKRGAKAAVSYTEADEDDSEVERWDEEAGKKQTRVSSSSNRGLNDSQSSSISPPLFRGKKEDTQRTTSSRDKSHSPPPRSRSSESQSVSEEMEKPSRSSNAKGKSKPTTAVEPKSTPISKKSSTAWQDDDFDPFLSPMTAIKASQASHAKSQSSTSQPKNGQANPLASKRKLSSGKVNTSLDTSVEQSFSLDDEKSVAESTDDLFEDDKKKNQKLNGKKRKLSNANILKNHQVTANHRDNDDDEEEQEDELLKKKSKTTAAANQTKNAKKAEAATAKTTTKSAAANGKAKELPKSGKSTNKRKKSAMDDDDEDDDHGDDEEVSSEVFFQPAKKTAASKGKGRSKKA